MKPFDDPIVVVDTTVEIVTLAEAKLACRVSNSVEDPIFGIYIEAARRALERATMCTFLEKTLLWVMDYWNGAPASYFGQPTVPQPGVGVGGLLPFTRYIELPRATPLIGIDSVTYTDSDGNNTVWDPAQYAADTYSRPGRLVLNYNSSWPQFTPAASNAIKIQYTAGKHYVYPTSIGADVRTAVLLLVGTMYANRESEIPVDNLAKQLLRLPIFKKLISGLRAVHECEET